ncbi:MAG: hypothetical protein J6B07_04355 [Opitutales bacterium]|nr:hypothetical protein [Opitutales bacterium]
MKALSLILRVVALLAAAACIYAWFDIKGRISEAENQMQAIKGATLAEKAPNAAKIHKENEGRKKTIASFQTRVKGLEKDISSLNSELENERAKNVSASADIVKRNSEIRSLNSKLVSFSKQVEERDATIDSLKKELVAKQELLSKQDDTDSLKEKIANLERKITEQEAELKKAQEKAKIADMSEVVEVIETDASGKKIKRKVVKVPYVPKGDIATITSQSGNIVSINKGKADGLNAEQEILLKKNGILIAEAFISNVDENSSVLLLNKRAPLFEYVEVNEQFELDTAEVKKTSEAKTE